MTPFDVSGKEILSKHCGKRRKCWKPAFSPILTIFSTLSKTKIIIYVTFILSSANTFNLDKVKFLSSEKGIKENKSSALPKSLRSNLLSLSSDNLNLLTLLKQTFVFTSLQYKSSENSMGNGEIVCNEQFLLFP